MADYIIGVDGGGSKTHAVLFNPSGAMLDESFSGSANIRSDIDLAYTSIINAIDSLVLKYAINPQQLKIGIGVAGYSVVANRELLERRLAMKYSQFILQSDAYIACLAANLGRDGAIIICGTGVVAYSIQDSVATQFGGWGFPHGDLGGGAWLGLEICKLVCKAIDNIIPWSSLLKQTYQRFNNNYAEYKTWLLAATPGDFATIARQLSEALEVDVNAQQILQRGVDEVRQYIAMVLVQTNQLPLSLVGGLAKFYLPLLSAEFPDLKESAVAPAIGASYLVKD